MVDPGLIKEARDVARTQRASGNLIAANYLDLVVDAVEREAAERADPQGAKMRLGRCFTCRWWELDPVFHHRTEGDKGRCRIRAPVRRDDAGAGWPISFATDWCGEYAARLDQTVEHQG